MNKYIKLKKKEKTQNIWLYSNQEMSKRFFKKSLGQKVEIVAIGYTEGHSNRIKITS